MNTEQMNTEQTNTEQMNTEQTNTEQTNTEQHCAGGQTERSDDVSVFDGNDPVRSFGEFSVVRDHDDRCASLIHFRKNVHDVVA